MGGGATESAPLNRTHSFHGGCVRVDEVADLEGAEPASTPFGRRTDAVTHGHVS